MSQFSTPISFLAVHFDNLTGIPASAAVSGCFSAGSKHDHDHMSEFCAEFKTNDVF